MWIINSYMCVYRPYTDPDEQVAVTSRLIKFIVFVFSYNDWLLYDNIIKNKKNWKIEYSSGMLCEERIKRNDCVLQLLHQSTYFSNWICYVCNVFTYCRLVHATKWINYYLDCILCQLMFQLNCPFHRL